MSDINITVNDEIVNIDIVDEPVLVNVVNSPGVPGAPGQGVPVGGTTGQVLAKSSNANYATAWVNVSGGAWGTITGTLSNQTDLQNALNAKFDDPTGTTSQYLRGDGSLATFPAIPSGTVQSVGLTMPSAFSVANSPITSSGTLAVTATGDTTQYIAGDGSLVAFPITGQAGTLVREVRNVTGATLTKGTVVYINGASGNKPTVAKALATGDTTSAQTFGLIQADIPNNSNGYLVAFGDLDGLNTSSFAEGVQLYLSSTTAGGYTSTKQYAPNHLVYIGVVTRQHVNQGRIEVRIQNGYEMDELHDVAAQTPSNNDGLFYNSSNSLWENKSIATALGYTPANSATTLTINGVSYDLSANRTFTVGSVTGSGASGQVAYWTGTSAQSGSNNLFWDATNSRLNFGSTLPTNVATQNIVYSTSLVGVSVKNTSSASGVTQCGFYTENNLGHSGSLFKTGGSYTTYKSISANDLGFYNTFGNISILNDYASGNIILTAGASSTAHMTLHNTGNLLLGSTTNSGERLQVTGDVKIVGSGATSATNALVVRNSSSTALLSVRNDGFVTIPTGISSGYVAVNVVRNEYYNTANNVLTAFRAHTSTGHVSFYNSVAIGTSSAPSASKLNITGLPTSPTGLSSGDVWNNLGVLTIV